MAIKFINFVICLAGFLMMAYVIMHQIANLFGINLTYYCRYL